MLPLARTNSNCEGDISLDRDSDCCRMRVEAAWLRGTAHTRDDLNPWESQGLRQRRSRDDSLGTEIPRTNDFSFQRAPALVKTGNFVRGFGFEGLVKPLTCPYRTIKN